MNRQKITDERVVRLNQKVQSEGFQAALLLAAASATVKTYVFDMGPRDVAAELIIILGSLCYVAVRSALLGHGFMDSSRWGKVLTAAAVVGLSLAVCVSRRHTELRPVRPAVRRCARRGVPGRPGGQLPLFDHISLRCPGPAPRPQPGGPAAAGAEAGGDRPGYGARRSAIN